MGLAEQKELGLLGLLESLTNRPKIPNRPNNRLRLVTYIIGDVPNLKALR
jgi:hypothetical protein